MKTFNTAYRTAKTSLTAAGTSVRFAALLALSIGAFAATANADQTADSRTQHVTLTSLNLSTVEGQKLAQARLLKVANTLCGQVSDELDLSHHANFIKCVDSAMAKASRQLATLVDSQSAVRVARAD